MRVIVAGLSTTCSQKIHKWVMCAAARVLETAGVTALMRRGRQALQFLTDWVAP